MATTRLCPTALALVMVAVSGAAFAAAAPEVLQVAEDGVMMVAFDEGLLQGLGLRVRVRAAGRSQTLPALATVPENAFYLEAVAGSGLLVQGDGRHKARLVGGDGRFSGEIELRTRSRRVVLRNPRLRPASGDGKILEWVDETGEVVLEVRHAHYDLDDGGSVFAIFNTDLAPARRLAEQLELAEIDRVTVGTLALRLELPVVGISQLEPRGSCPPGDWFVGGDPANGIEVDVALIDIGGVAQRGAVDEGMVPIAPSAELKNVGLYDVPWHAQFTGPCSPYDNDQHPFLAWSLYRLLDGRLEQLAISPVKHAFFATNTNCPAIGGHVLEVGCQDTYSENNNSSDGFLSLREEITAHSGEWTNLGSHFDQEPPGGDGTQDHTGGAHSGASLHRLRVAESDLDLEGARYFLEAWYLVRDDVNIFNTMGHVEVDPTEVMDGWVFPRVLPIGAGAGEYFVEGPVIDAWVDPVAPQPGALNTLVDSDEGELELAVTTADLGGGLYRFDYVLANFDYDRKIATITLPIQTGVDPKNPYFVDPDDDGGNDWTLDSGDPDLLVWSAPADNELDWGSSISFGFEAEVEPTAAELRLDSLEPGAGSGIFIVETLTPGGALTIFSDGFESGDTAAWSETEP